MLPIQPRSAVAWEHRHLPESCYADPEHEVDFYAVCHLRTMTAIWMGLDTVEKAKKEGRMALTGTPEIASSIQEWLGLSPFAREDRMVS